MWEKAVHLHRHIKDRSLHSLVVVIRAEAFAIGHSQGQKLGLDIYLADVVWERFPPESGDNFRERQPRENRCALFVPQTEHIPVVVGMEQRNLSVGLKLMAGVNMLGQGCRTFHFKDTDGWRRGRRHQHKIKMRLDGDALVGHSYFKLAQRGQACGFQSGSYAVFIPVSSLKRQCLGKIRCPGLLFLQDSFTGADAEGGNVGQAHIALPVSQLGLVVFAAWSRKPLCRRGINARGRCELVSFIQTPHSEQLWALS